MARDNVLTITGNLTRDPELRYTPGGVAVCNFGIAWNPPRKQDQSGNWVDQDPSFFDVSCWAELAEHVAQLGKGTRVTVVGNLEQRSWDDKTTGDKRSKVEIRADEVGASLRWATVDVTRAERGGNGTPAKAPAGGAPKSYEADEEPFAITDPWHPRWAS